MNIALLIVSVILFVITVIFYLLWKDMKEAYYNADDRAEENMQKLLDIKNIIYKAEEERKNYIETLSKIKEVIVGKTNNFYKFK